MVLSPKLVSWHSAVHIHVYSQFTLQQFIASSFIPMISLANKRAPNFNFPLKPFIEYLLSISLHNMCLVIFLTVSLIPIPPNVEKYWTWINVHAHKHVYMTTCI